MGEPHLTAVLHSCRTSAVSGNSCRQLLPYAALAAELRRELLHPTRDLVAQLVRNFR